MRWTRVGDSRSRRSRAFPTFSLVPVPGEMNDCLLFYLVVSNGVDSPATGLMDRMVS